jgi:hypothetical protein
MQLGVPLLENIQVWSGFIYLFCFYFLEHTGKVPAHNAVYAVFVQGFATGNNPFFPVVRSQIFVKQVSHLTILLKNTGPPALIFSPLIKGSPAFSPYHSWLAGIDTRDYRSVQV